MLSNVQTPHPSNCIQILKSHKDFAKLVKGLVPIPLPQKSNYH